MPGNEVGDRVHNFFGQENLYQGQHQSQAADGSWVGLNNNLWVRNQREINSPFTSNLKSYSAHQPDSGGLGLHSHSLHGLNFSQSYITPEIVRSGSQNQHQSLNGYAAGQQHFHARQIEANFLGAEAVSNRHISSSGLSIHEAQANNPELSRNNVARLETTDSPVNFDFFGGQQLSGRNPSVTQILPNQPLGNPNMQLMQQPAVLSRIQELQRQHQLQQHEARQHGSMNQISSNSKSAVGNHPATFDGIPVNELSTSWRTEHMVNNTNSLQHSLSSPMQGPSSGFVFPSEQQQSLRFMGLLPEQVDQSLYGVPVSNANNFLGTNSLISIDKSTMQQLSVNKNPVLGSHYTAYPDGSGQVSMQDGMAARQDFQGKSMFGISASQGLNVGLNSENLQHANQQRNTSMHEFVSRQEFDARSEAPQEKTMAQIAPSPNVATLDPTEEKILYGSDDNLWDAFGMSDNITAGGYNMVDGNDCNSGYSFSQSGRWSALMQSAVAETSSGDMNVQEGWSGVNDNNSGTPNGNRHPLDPTDSGKLQPVWVDNNLQTLNSRRSYVYPEANNRPNNYNNSANVPVFQQPGHRPFSQQTEGFQNSSAQSSTPTSLDGERKWIDRNLQPDGRNLSENKGNNSGMEINADNLAGSWVHQQNVSSYNSQSCKPNGWSYIEPMFSHEGSGMKNHENLNMSQSSQGGDLKRNIREEMGSAIVKQNHDSISSPTGELQHADHTAESSQVYNEDAHLINNAAVANASSLRGDPGSRQHNHINQHFSFWKDANSSMELKESGFVAKYQHHRDKGSQMLESPGNSCLEKGATEMYEVENSNASDTHTSSENKQKVGGNIVQKSSVTSRRFQYHPMGNLDMDVEDSFGTRSHATQPQAHVQQKSHGFKGGEASNFRQSKSGTDVNSMEVEKSDTRAFGDIPSKRMLPPFGSRFSSSLDILTGHDPRQVPLPFSQNMLELLHKVDQPREHGNATHSHSYRNPSSEMGEAETSDGSVGQAPQNQSSDSQVFGLQLGPPQRLSMQDAAQSSHCSSPMVMSKIHPTSETGDRGHMLLAPVASKHRDLKNNITGPGHSGNKITLINAQGMAAASQSVFPYPRSQLHNQRLVANHSANVFSDKIGMHSRNFDDSSEQVENSQKASTDISRSGIQMNLVSSADTSQLSSGDMSNSQNSPQLVPELGSVSMSQRAAFSKVSPNEWVNVTTQKHSLHAEPSKAASDVFKSHMHMENSDKSFSGQRKTDDQEKLELDTMPPGKKFMNMQNISGEDKKTHECPGKQVSGEKNEISLPAAIASGELEPTGHHSLGASPSNSMATQLNIDTFGYSLNPNISSRHRYSLLHHVHGKGSADNDPTNRSGKRFKGPDCGLDSQQVSMDGTQLLSHGHSNAARESLLNSASISRVDAALVNFSSKKGDAYVSSSSDIASGVRGEHSQISPQMAPSWSDQYGTSKNGQTLTVFPGSKIATMKPLDQPFIVENPPDGFNAQIPLKQANASADCNEHNNARESSTLMSIDHGNLSASQPLPFDFTNQSFAAVRPKKRKTSSPELLPWNDEMIQSLIRLQDISMANVYWAQATNRLVEKREDEIQMIDDGLIIKPRRRVNLTTQLVQQLLRPPPLTTLSSDASLHYESATYFVGRLALGDACNIVSSTGTDNASHPNSKTLLSERLNVSGRTVDHKFVEGLEDFTRRAQKMEDDLLSVEKRASILDLRVECQDLEKFSVINRFAKFHSRGQGDGGEPSSSSDVTTTGSQRSCPQKYVTALPIPKNLPDRVQCLSL